MAPPKAYLTLRPWEPFTPRERKRGVALSRCPSSACRRAKACVDAHDDLYCQKSHESVAEALARQGLVPRRPKPGPVAKASKPLTFRQVQAKRILLDMQLAEAQARNAGIFERWKAGELDGLYGPFRPRGVLKVPPIRQYTE